MATESPPRQSSDSRRPSLGFSRKSSEVGRSEKAEKPRRFSLLPASFSLKGLTGGSRDQNPDVPKYGIENRPKTSQPVNYSYANASSRGSIDVQRYDGNRENNRHVSAPQQRNADRPPPRSAPYPASNQHSSPWQGGTPGLAYPLGEPAPAESDASFAQYSQQQPGQQSRYPQGFNDFDEQRPRASMQQGRGAKLHKPNRKFNDAWDQDHENGHHAGSTGAARRVMDFFRRRGKARAGDER